MATPVITLRTGHRYRARFVAPAPCQVIPPPAINAAMQALGAQAGLPSPWAVQGFNLDPAGIGCRVTVTATWNARDAVIDPELAQLPGIGALPVEEVVDETTGEVVYDLRRMPRPVPPGPAPAPPPSGGPPPPGGGPTPPRPPGTTKKRSPGLLAGIVIGAVGILWIASVRYEASRRR